MIRTRHSRRLLLHLHGNPSAAGRPQAPLREASLRISSATVSTAAATAGLKASWSASDEGSMPQSR